ncbi:MAG: hypothetical protein BGO43_05130 [Gammaproteobacteria bacterium 39-13]|nr:hypothetical protein [Gammaproteobacteria bacterium]OJV96233.1 MAG: hypothetical protein BGO43_05130 [Gammaproteobacteria bacterium 39-13]
MLEMMVNKDTKLQQYINSCQFPSPPPGKTQAQAKTQHVPDSMNWKQAVRREITKYIKDNMPHYTAQICKENGGIRGDGQNAACQFLEKNRTFASEELLGQYDFPKYLDKKKKKSIKTSKSRPKSIELLSAIMEEDVSPTERRPRSENFETMHSAFDFQSLQNLLKELESEDGKVEYTTISPSNQTFITTDLSSINENKDKINTDHNEKVKRRFIV